MYVDAAVRYRYANGVVAGAPFLGIKGPAQLRQYHKCVPQGPNGRCPGTPLLE
jgi:hypothetical protein